MTFVSRGSKILAVPKKRRLLPPKPLGDIRRDRHMKQSELARLSGVSQPTIALLEAGRPLGKRVDHAKQALLTRAKVAAALKLTVAEILFDRSAS